MTTPSLTPPEQGGFHLDWRVAQRFARFAGRYWTGSTARQAWMLTLALACSLILSTVVTVAMNQWNRWFFDALERRDVDGLKQAVLVFFVIVAAMAAIGVGIVISRMTLQVRWRQWLVEHLIGKWLERQKFYHLNASGIEPPNPEYRISDDTRWATEVLVDLGIGLMTAVMGGIAFITILWSVGGSFGIGGVMVPGYMVWCALAYGIAASTLTAWVGRPLVGRVGQKNEAEGYFRFAMMRLRDNAESIALVHGAAAEQQVLRRFYDTVVGRWLAIVRSNAQLTWITNATGPMIPIVPLLFAAPKYLAGDLTLGQVTQLAAAFVQVQQAISWIVDNYSRIADWYASARRVMDIVDASETIEPHLPAPRQDRPLPHGQALALDHVTLHAADGHPLLLPVTLALKRGEAVHVAGPSNTGKSTLARILAGLVVPSGGKLQGVGPQSILLLPQKSYLPLGTLAEAIAYPQTGAISTAAELLDALQAVGLGSLTSRLSETVRWDQVLSAGDRQRLAAARALIMRPDVLVIDDALSALDGAAQRALIQRLRREIPELTILSLGQRAAPADTFDRVLELTRLDHDAMLARTAT
jgi:vitamin B12/bleomycin/antimicrobial peptide transport system ATP-binding/permease protein